MSTIKRIIISRPSNHRGHVICEIRYPSGKAEMVEITDAEYRIHQLKESLDDAGINMMVVKELENLMYAQGYEKAVGDRLEKEKVKKKCGTNPWRKLLFLNLWKSNTHASGA